MMKFANRIQASSLALAFLVACPTVWLACSRSFESNYNSVKENTQKEQTVVTTANTALRGDERIKAILEGGDETAKAELTTALDAMETAGRNGDGVVYALIVEALMADTSLTGDAVAARIKALAAVLQLLETGEDHMQISATVGDSDAGDAARDAMDAYAAGRGQERAQNLANRYAAALATAGIALTDRAPLSVAIVRSASDAASSGPDSVQATVDTLKTVEGASTGVDADVETPKTGLAVTGVLLNQVQAVYEAAVAKNYSDDAEIALLGGLGKTIHASGDGMTQVAAVVAGRTLKDFVTTSTDTTAAAVTVVSTDLVTAASARLELAQAARSVAASDEEKTSIEKVLAQINQSFSQLQSSASVTSSKEQFVSLKDQVQAAVSSAATVATTLQSGFATISQSTGGGGSGTIKPIVGGTNITCEWELPQGSTDGSKVFVYSTMVATGYAAIRQNNVCTKLQAPDGATRTIALAGGLKIIKKSLYILGSAMVNGSLLGGYWKDGVWTFFQKPSDCTLSTLTVSGTVETVDQGIIFPVACEAGASDIAGYYKEDGSFTQVERSANVSILAPFALARGNSFALIGSRFVAYPTNSFAGEWVGGTWSYYDYSTQSNTIDNHNVTYVGILGSDEYVYGYHSTASAIRGGYWKNKVWTEHPGQSGSDGYAVLATADLGIERRYLVGLKRLNLAAYGKLYETKDFINLTEYTFPAGVTAISAPTAQVIGNDLYVILPDAGYYKNGIWQSITKTGSDAVRILGVL